MAAISRAFRTDPYAYAEAAALADALEVSEPVAVTLVRRGLSDPAQARAFLEAAERHDPSAFRGIDAICGRILDAISARRRIAVHGDYDVDGVCATAVLGSALRDLGADWTWAIPDRISEGYGLAAQTIERLAGKGYTLLLTVDCGIGSADEVALAREAGLEVVVTDHHEPGKELPDCPILHPRVSGYPCPDLCGAAVAWKLAAALREKAGRDPAEAEDDLDLVALATVADLVPLTGENRSLVRTGLEVARRAGRPGLRALIAEAGCDPARLDEGDLAFRLGPRINAAGRIGRADAGVELMLTRDQARAGEVAAELGRANHERRRIERDVLRAVQAARAELPPSRADAAALVLAGEGWHPGVVGIVASRLVEELWRPVVLVALDGDAGRGSGRSIPGYDLLAGLRHGADHLERFGGHRAAAGVEVRADRVEAFARSLAAHAEENLDPSDLIRTRRIDAVIGADGLGLGLCEELERLGPFGQGNPGVSILVPAATLGDVRPMGEEGRHVRFSLESGGVRARGVGFGTGSSLAQGACHVAVRLEANEWNGVVEPRAVLRDLYPLGDEETVSPLPWCDLAEWWRRALGAPDPGGEPPPPGGPGRRVVDRRGRSAVASLCELASTGEPLLAVCADASRRQGLAARLSAVCDAAGVGLAVACGRAADAALPAEPEGVLLADWALVARRPDLLHRAIHAAAVDPPPHPWLRDLVSSAPGGGRWLHLLWGPAEVELSRRVVEHNLDLRAALRSAWPAIVGADGGLEGEGLRAALEGPGSHPRLPEACGLMARVLREVGLAELPATPPLACVRAVSSEKTDLEGSATFRAAERLREDSIRFLTGPTPKR